MRSNNRGLWGEWRGSNLLYVLFFLILSFMMVIPYIHSGKIVASADWLFHAERVEQIYQNLKSGELFTFIASTTFHHSGVGSFLFYPTFFMYPWAIFRLFFNPITSFYLWYGLITFLTFVIAFYCMKIYSKNSRLAVIFSFVYTFSSYRLYLGQFPFGEFCAISILPLVFLGFDLVFFEDEELNVIPGWIMLSVGMTLLIYSHLVSVIIVLEIFVLILTVYCLNNNWSKILNISKIISVAKAILLTILLSLPMIYLFVNDFIGKKITSAYFGISMRLVQSVSSRIDMSLDNSVSWGVGLILMMTILVGWYGIRNSCKDLWIYILGVSLFLVSTSLFPWFLAQKSFLGVIQLPYRYLGEASLFLSVIAAKFIKVSLEKLKINNLIGILLILFICSFTYLNGLSNNVMNFRSGTTEINASKIKLESLPNVILNKNNYSKQFNYVAPFGETDYYPKLAFSKNRYRTIISQTAYINKEAQQINSVGKPNLIKIDLKKGGKKVNLPIVCYHDTFVKVNGRFFPYSISNRGTVLLSNVPKNSKIEVGYNPGWKFYVTIGITTTVWAILIVYWLLKVDGDISSNNHLKFDKN